MRFRALDEEQSVTVLNAARGQGLLIVQDASAEDEAMAIRRTTRAGFERGLQLGDRHAELGGHIERLPALARLFKKRVILNT